MDQQSRLISIENDKKFIEVAQRFLSGDPRVEFRIEDAATVINSLPPRSFDLIFADTWAGKYTHLNEALELLKAGGIYVIDDMLPQPTWPEDHAPKVERLMLELEGRSDLVVTKLNWASGIIIAVKKAAIEGQQSGTIFPAPCRKCRKPLEFRFCEPTSVFPPADFRLQALDRPPRILPTDTYCFVGLDWHGAVVPSKANPIQGNCLSMSVKMEQNVKSFEVAAIAKLA